MDSLIDLFRSLGNSLELEEVLSTLDQELRRLIPYRALAVYLVEDDRFTPVYAPVGGMQRLSEGLFESALMPAVRQDRPVEYFSPGEATESDWIFPIAAPSEQRQQVTALLVLRHDSETAFSQRDLEILRAITPKLASCIENARKYARAEQSVEVDPRTGLANVRSLFQRLDAELARARRCRNTVAVLQCSVGGFDRSGCLCSAAATRTAFEKVALKLRENCREYDFSARSGDELVLVLPGLRRELLRDKRESMRRIVEEAGLNAGLPLFVAIGEAFFPEDGNDAEDLLAAAAHRVILARQIDSDGESRLD